MTDINKLAQAKEFALSMNFPVYDTAARQPRKLSGQQVFDKFAASAQGIADQAAASALEAQNAIPTVQKADYTELRAYTGNATVVYVTGYLVSSTPSGIAGTFTRDDSDTTSSDNGGTIIVASNGKRWKRVYSGAVDVRWFGAKGDGATDDTAAIQAAIDAHKGKKIIIPQAASQYVLAGVLLSGAPYNGTELEFQGEMLLKARGGIGVTNFGGAWVGLILKDCDGVTLTFRGHGNRTNQPASEHCHLVGLAGVTNLSVPFFKGREVRGDGMYVSQSTWGVSSANTDGITIGVYEVTNTADDGRNGLSIISGDNITIGTFRSNKVGAVVGVRQPGGLDIEPDHDYQSCKNIVIGSVDVVTTGTSGLAIQGRAGVDVTRGVTVGSARVVNTCTPDQNDELAALTQTINHTLFVRNAADVNIESYQGRFTNAYGDAVLVSNSSGVKMTGSVRHVREGARIGNDADDATGSGVTESDISLEIHECCRYGFRTGKLTDTTIRGKVYSNTAGFFPASLFAVYARDYAQTNVTYSVSVTATLTWKRTYRNDAGAPATFTNCAIRDCDLSGTWGDVVFQIGDIIVPRYNVRGVTDRSSAPLVTTTGFSAGQYIRNNTPAVGSPKGWYLVAGAWVSEGNL